MSIKNGISPKYPKIVACFGMIVFQLINELVVSHKKKKAPKGAFYLLPLSPIF